MKGLFISIAVSLVILNSGCLGTAVFTPQATLMRFGVFNDTAVNNASLRWGPVRLDVGEYANKGDVESIDAVGNAISNGIIAWFTYGTAPAVKGAVKAALSTTSTNAPGCATGDCSPGTINHTPRVKDAPVCDPAAPAGDPDCVPQTPFTK